jgi:hypothetical protein
MRYLGKLMLSVGTFLVAFLLVSFGVIRVTEGLDFSGSHASEAEFVLSLLLFPGMPIAIGYLCAAGVWRLLRGPATGVVPRQRSWRRLLVRLAIAAYLFTWAFGVPAVQTSLDTDTVEAYKLMKEQMPQEVRNGHPHMKSYVSLPILPGLIATYYECQYARLSGLGAWKLHAWWLTGVKEIFCLPSWIS